MWYVYILECKNGDLYTGLTDNLQRRFDDPDGAITAARTLLETVCKHILDLSEINPFGNIR